MDEKKVQKLNTVISVVFIIAAAVLFSAALKHRGAAPAPVPDDAAATGTPATDATQAYDDLAGMQQLQLAKDFASWTPDARLEDEKTRAVSLAIKGKVAKAYLSVKASVGGKPLSKYESIFVKFGLIGGHLFRPQSLPTPASEGSTSLLFDLSGLPVLPSVPYDEARTPDKVDAAALLADGKTVKLTAFISSLRPALLEDLSLSYVCADGSDCAIGLK